MTPDDLSLLHGVADPRVSPDGARAVYVVSRLDVEEDEVSSRLHLIDLASGDDRVLTAGPKDSSPRWSPEGETIAFVRAGQDSPGQLALIDPDGGEARVLTAVPEGVDGPVWTPDGATIVVASNRWRDGAHETDADERAKRPRRITELGYRSDDQGWLHDRVKRLYAVDVEAAESTTGDGDADPDRAGGPLTALTPADVSVESHVVTSGGHVVFASARQESRETDAMSGVWRVALDGSGADADGVEELVAPRPLWGVVAGHDDDVLLLGHEDRDEWPAPPRLFRLTPDGAVTDLTPDLDRDVVGAVALDDGGALIRVEERGATVLSWLSADGDEVTTLVGGAQTVSGVDATDDGTTVVYVADHPEDPGELWVLSDRDGEPRVLTDHNAELRETLLPVQHITYERDGAEVDAWLLLPEGDDADVPLLLNVHGGPTGQYGATFFDEFQVYAAAGYAVVGCNPRGSSGRGAEWSNAVVGDVWGEDDAVDVLDIEAAVDAAQATSDRVSRDRIGIMGGSYGGYATARIIAGSDRYRSAIVERGLLNWVSFAGTSDIGPYFDRMFLGREFGDDATLHWRASPVRTAGNITTPTLVLHSFEDYRCPVEQALQFFQRLRRAGTEAELVLFPGEGHELSRSGSPKHRQERFEIILEWHDSHLGVERPADPADDAGDADDDDDDEDAAN